MRHLLPQPMRAFLKPHAARLHPLAARVAGLTGRVAQRLERIRPQEALRAEPPAAPLPTSPRPGAYARALAHLQVHKHEPTSPERTALLRELTREEREALAAETSTLVVYLDEEVAAAQRAEEEAALRAAPSGHPLERLNGLNVGCGERTVHPALVGLDVHRGAWAMGHGSSQHYTSRAALLSHAHRLPFLPESVDFVVALHILEHMADPVGTVLHWLSVVKPGGGVGIVVPDWRYTWSASWDDHPLGHRFDPTPERMREMYEQHWKDHATLEHFHTYPYKLSFDLVLRKHGTFVPFSADTTTMPTGKQLADARKAAEGMASVGD